MQGIRRKVVYVSLYELIAVTLTSAALILLGLGWNFAFVGASTLVAEGLDVVGLIVGGEDPKRPGYA